MKKEKKMECMACGKKKPVSEGKTSISGNSFLCHECDRVIGKGPGYADRR